MVMLRRLMVTRAILAGWLAIFGLMLAGCSVISAAEYEAWLNKLVGSSHVLTESVKIRIVNQSSSVLSLELSVDGVVDTMTCDDQEICETALEYCPSEISLVSERRFDSDGTFLSGQDFDDTDDFTLTRDDFECTETVILKFTESDTSILIL